MKKGGEMKPKSEYKDYEVLLGDVGATFWVFFGVVLAFSKSFDYL